MFAGIVRRVSARSRLALVGSFAILLVTSGVASAAIFAAPLGVDAASINPFGEHTAGEEVGNRLLLPDDQWVSPVGRRVTLENKLAVGGALSPDGETEAVVTDVFEGASGITLVDVGSGQILQQVAGGKPGIEAVRYSPDGRSLWAAEITSKKNAGHGVIERFEVGPEGKITDAAAPVGEVKLAAQQHFTLTGHAPASAVPSAMVFSEDGSRLYVVESANNTVAVIDTETNQLLNEIPVGNAPRDIVIAGEKAYVSDEGGRPAEPGDYTDESDGTPIVADPSTSSPTTGTVSVVNLSSEAVTATIPVGLEPEGEAVGEGAVFVANSNSDSVSVIDTSSDEVVQTISVEPLPGQKEGAVPTSIAMPDPHHLLVTVLRDNAVAEFAYDGPRSPVAYQGVIPTDWGPDQVLYDDPLDKVLVTNAKGTGARTPQPQPGAFDTTAVDSTVGIFSPPAQGELEGLTRQVSADNGWSRLEAEEELRPDERQGKPAAIPRRLGEPSPIKHVFLIIKENRSYDQVLGDIGKGNGDPALATYGEPVTPNSHRLADEFTLFDNFYDPSIASSLGHNWIAQAGPNGYLEWDEGIDSARAYTHNDALVYQHGGFLWDAAKRAHQTVRDYGEWMDERTAPEPTFSGNAGGSNPLAPWKDWSEDAKVLAGKLDAPLDVPLDKYQWFSDVQSANEIADHDYPSNPFRILDQYRVGVWEQEFKQDEKSGQLANLTIIWIPDDHTAGEPTGAAMVADNDLALGRIVSTVSHSQFWKSSAIFAEEDDSSNGLDHVDGHRGPLWVASPYAKRGAVDSEYFTQLNVDKTIEQILGIQPMNQRDAAAAPMFSAFTNQPDDKPYEVLHNQIPLSLGVPGDQAETEEEEKEIAELDAEEGKAAPDAQNLLAVPADERAVAHAWGTWHKDFAEPRLERRGPDALNPNQTNRYDWYQAKGWSKPYPGDKKILGPAEVPGGYHQLGELGDG